MQVFEDFDKFKQTLLIYYMQEEALKHNISYFDVTTSNMDGTIFGEMFDNSIRIKMFKNMNPEFAKKLNEDELIAEAKENFNKDYEIYKLEGVTI